MTGREGHTLRVQGVEFRRVGRLGLRGMRCSELCWASRIGIPTTSH